jgi:hypothetical protein
MKISPGSTRRRQDGVAVIVILALLSILLIYVLANARSLHHLGRELKLLEQRQVQRLNSRAITTNSVPTTTAPSLRSQTPVR